MTDVTFHPGHVLCPVDFSDLSLLALKYAATAARHFESRLTVMHAESFEVPRYLTESMAARIEQELAAQRESAEDYLRSFSDRALGGTGGGLQLEYRVVQVQPAQAILETSRQERVGMIVMGTHGRSGLQRFLLGSVTEDVVENTSVPLLTVREMKGQGAEIWESGNLPRVRSILCPVNISAVSKTALGHAVSVARQTASSLSVIFIAEDAPEKEVAPQLADWIKEVVGSYPHETIVTRGHAAEKILSALKTGEFDLVVLGAQHQPFFGSTFLGRTTELVLRHAPVPVLVVPRHD